MTKTPSANADVLHRFVTAFNPKDEDALGKILTPDVVDHYLPPGLPAGIRRPQDLARHRVGGLRRQAQPG